MNTDLLKHYGVLGVAGFCLLLATAANAAPPAKVDVCHAPPGNPENIQLIQVGANGGALDAHLSHGDWLASEEMCDAIADNNCDGVAGTQLEDDASCNDNDPATADSCVATECVNVQIAQCPCDFTGTVPPTSPPWPGPTVSKTLFPGPPPALTDCRVVISGAVSPLLRILDLSTPGAVRSCQVGPAGGPFPIIDGLTTEEWNACADDIDAYATALNAVPGITVSNVTTPCPRL